MTTRRKFIGGVGLSGGLLGAGLATRVPAAGTASDRADRLEAEINAMPVDDTHCHPIGDRDARTTVDGFIERIALAAFPSSSYFPEGVYDRYKQGDAAIRTQLDRQFGIGKTLD